MDAVIQIMAVRSYQKDMTKLNRPVDIFHTVVKSCLVQHLGVFAGDAEGITN